MMTKLDRIMVEFSARMTASYGDLPRELILWRRLYKPSEEAAEVLRALAGAVGENPRKGVTNTYDEVKSELLDTAGAALGAYSEMCKNENINIVDDLTTHMNQRLERIREWTKL